jgi:hypothetical protein
MSFTDKFYNFDTYSVYQSIGSSSHSFATPLESYNHSERSSYPNILSARKSKSKNSVLSFIENGNKCITPYSEFYTDTSKILDY